MVPQKLVYVLAALMLALMGCPRKETHDAGKDAGAPPEHDSGLLDSNAETSDAGFMCDPITGTPAPSPLCSLTRTCQSPSGEVTTPTNIPACNGANFDDGPPVLRIVDDVERYHCAYVPPGTSPMNRRPLVIFLHGGYGSADAIYRNGLRASAENFDMSGDNARGGFMLLSVQSRNLGFDVPSPLPEGALHEFWFWDLAQPTTNPDVKNLDQIIDGAVDQGADSDRIYVMGHSAGGLFAQLYGMARSGATTTPGGQRVAAASVYSGPDPFHLRYGQQVCERPLPTDSFPIFSVSRACDIVACDAEQLAKLEEETGEHGGAFSMTDWQARYPLLEWSLVDGFGVEAQQCAATCAYSTALSNHLRWPQSKHEDLLIFLREHVFEP